MRIRKLILERSPGHGDLCFTWSYIFKKATWAGHISVGPPVWWKPDFSKKKKSGGYTEWRAGWLLMAVQIARKPHRE